MQMHGLLLTSAALALAAAPAFAQTNTPAGSQTNQSGAGAASASQMGGQNATIRQHIAQQLSQAGFTDVHVMPESFLVRAKNPQGYPVLMVINPDSITAVTAVGAQAGGHMAQGGGGAAGTGTPNGNGAAQR
ncbi:MAG TPA: hypothetical protein VJ779_03680 [Acetobacteraceae bacterium]|nr:hypothetical protein [Acetobacteraceae bacterium]